MDNCVPACPASQARGRAAHLKPVTRNDLARRYGYFLDFLTGRACFRWMDWRPRM